MKFLFSALILLVSFTAKSEVTKVTLQASGLTCSMCSNSINKSLKSLPFVEKVMSNIKTSSFEITFKPGTNVDFDQLKKKVEDAGFFVAKFIATINFAKQPIKNDDHVVIGNTTYHFLSTPDQVLTGERTLQLLDKGYVTAKQFKKNASLTAMDCYKTGTIMACCKKATGMKQGTRVFHVTLAA